jgi:hypothetical protein
MVYFSGREIRGTYKANPFFKQLCNNGLYLQMAAYERNYAKNLCVCWLALR